MNAFATLASAPVRRNPESKSRRSRHRPRTRAIDHAIADLRSALAAEQAYFTDEVLESAMEPEDQKVIDRTHRAADRLAEVIAAVRREHVFADSGDGSKAVGVETDDDIAITIPTRLFQSLDRDLTVTFVISKTDGSLVRVINAETA